MDAANRNRMHWELSYILILTALMMALAAWVRWLPVQLVFAVLAAALAANIGIWKRRISRTVIYLHNGLNMISAPALAYLLSSSIFAVESTVICAVVGIVAMDLISFTKKGRFTLNAKLMAQYTTAARLSICLPVPGKRGLTPVIGAGDLVFYAVLTMVSLRSAGEAGPLFAELIILGGQLLNIAVILAVKDRTGFKGFPATLMPGLLFVVFLVPGIPA